MIPDRDSSKLGALSLTGQEKMVTSLLPARAWPAFWVARVASVGQHCGLRRF